MTLFAGEVAEHIRYGKPIELPDAGKGSDRDGIGLLLLKYSVDPEGVDSYREEIKALLTTLLSLHWAAVEAVAKALLEHKRLSYKQVRAIYEK
jgi:hypothetical protein